MPFLGFCSVTNCYSAGLARRARLSTPCPATPAMILSKQCALGSAQAQLEQVWGAREARNSNCTGSIMLDSQIQAQGFVDLEVEATKDFFLFFFFFYLLSEHICLRIIGKT